MAKKTAKTWEELRAMLESDIVEIMGTMSKNENYYDNDEPRLVLVESIDENVYGTYDAEWYDSKTGLGNSVKATKPDVVGNSIGVGLYHDIDEKLYDPEYPRYGSTYDIREYLPDIIEGEIEWGYNDMFPADGAWRRETRYQQKAAEDLQNGRFLRWMRRKLKQKGYDAK